jgi:hypothetical protein
MAIRHAGAGVSHHILDLLSHRWFIAMHLAVGTGRLILLEWASVETSFCIIQKPDALRAKFVMSFMLIMTVDMYHGFNSFPLPPHPAFLSKHDEHLLSFKYHDKYYPLCMYHDYNVLRIREKR